MDRLLYCALSSIVLYCIALHYKYCIVSRYRQVIVLCPGIDRHSCIYLALADYLALVDIQNYEHESTWLLPTLQTTTKHGTKLSRLISDHAPGSANKQVHVHVRIISITQAISQL